jgi:hypothetical protein
MMIEGWYDAFTGKIYQIPSGTLIGIKKKYSSHEDGVIYEQGRVLFSTQTSMLYETYQVNGARENHVHFTSISPYEIIPWNYYSEVLGIIGNEFEYFKKNVMDNIQYDMPSGSVDITAAQLLTAITVAGYRRVEGEKLCPRL